MSPYHLASRVRQEQGTTGHPSVRAAPCRDTRGDYNHFNIGAYTANGNSAETNGAIYAKNVSSSYYGPWTDPIRSIKGGAKILTSGYVSCGQDTLYFQKFNVVTAPFYSHQYMTNIMAPSSESLTMKKAYSDNLNIALVFRIPVYKNMPESAVPKPEKPPPEQPGGPAWRHHAGCILEQHVYDRAPVRQRK